MNNVNWIDIVPSAMSALAGIGAAIAAFGSLKVSREAKQIAEQSALAVHHAPATIALADSIDLLGKNLGTFSEAAYNVWVEWAREIEEYDRRQLGGDDPRPLRHVLSNASEMLVEHGSKRGAQYLRARRSMFAIVRDGVAPISDAEYKKLLRIADGKYEGFESIFGEPSQGKSIRSAPAFRWAYFQLIKRVGMKEWFGIWKGAWAIDGCLSRYREEYENIKMLLCEARERLASEKSLLDHSVFPLEANPDLFAKYSKVMEIIDVLLDDCGLDIFDGYIERPHEEDVVPLIMYSMGIAYLSNTAIENEIPRFRS